MQGFSGLVVRRPARSPPTSLCSVQGQHRFGDTEVIEQASAVARILREDAVDATQYLDRAQCNVVQITDRRGAM